MWERYTGDLVGCRNLGNAELNAATLKKTGEFASHLLVFLVRTVFLFLFWEAVGIFYDKYKLNVLKVTSDGA